MAKLTFKKLAENILQNSDKPLSVDEIWNIACLNGLANDLSSVGKTPLSTLNAQIYVDMKKSNSIFKKISKGPVRFGLVNKNYESLQVDDDSSSEGQNLKNTNIKSRENLERCLHKLLSTFAFVSADFNCYTKTILHEESKKNKKGKNTWLHPDIVGVYYPFEEYTSETLELYSTMVACPYKLYSFELKLDILTLSNLKEYYFQAVSNSSWANEGYLVAKQFSNDFEFREELKRLNSAFGIGVIEINLENVSQSEVILPAKYKEQLDFRTIERLVEINDIFKEFINNVSSAAKIRKIVGAYDNYFEGENIDEEAREYCKKNNLV